MRATVFIPLRRRAAWVIHARLNDAQVLSRESAYDSEDEAADALGVECATIADGAERARCEALAGDLAAYIAAHNRYGTAQPLGGSTSLRAYREFRFRAAHTRLGATELRLRLIWHLEGVLFLERGYAADRSGDVFDEPRDSYGVGLRSLVFGFPLRLETARGDEGDAWFFTAGMPW